MSMWPEEPLPCDKAVFDLGVSTEEAIEISQFCTWVEEEPGDGSPEFRFSQHNIMHPLIVTDFIMRVIASYAATDAEIVMFKMRWAEQIELFNSMKQNINP